MPRTKRKLRWLQFFSWLFLLGPITGVAIFNFKDYFSPEKGFVFKQSVEVGMGTILALATGIMLALGKSKAFKGSRGLLIGLLLAIFLNSILNDLILILFALSGGSLAFEGFKPFVNGTKEIYKQERNAMINAEAMRNVLNEPAKQPIKTKKLGRV